MATAEPKTPAASDAETASPLVDVRGSWRKTLDLGGWLWQFGTGRGPHESDEDEAHQLSSVVGEEVAGMPMGSDWLQTLLYPMRGAYRQLLALSFAVNLLAMFSAIYAMQVYDRVVGHGAYATLAALTISMGVIILMDGVFRGGRSLLLQRIGARIEVHVAQRTFERLLALPLSELERRPPAYWQTVFRDVELVRATCSGATAMLLLDLPFMVLSLAFIGFIAWQMLPLVALAVVLFVVLAWRSGDITRDAAEQEQVQLVQRDSMVSELAAARYTLKALAATASARERWEQQYVRWMNESLYRSHQSDRYREWAHALSTITTTAFTSVGAILILGQWMTLGALIAVNILVGKLIAPLVQAVALWRTYGQFIDARKRLTQLFELPLDRQHSEVKLPRPAPVLTAEDISFQYAGTERAQLNPLSGQLGPNGLHAIVGPNGSGKTTLLKILRGLYKPASGRVLLDGADMQQFTTAELAEWVGYLAQQPQLLSGTIKSNITLGHPQATDAQIIAAATKAGAHDFIIQLPDGYATEMGESGSRFSGGQRKRIAIAQVLLMDPPVLLLDEPTSDLDFKAERDFVQTLRDLAQDHLVLCVTHSPVLLARCNGIMVLDQGELVAAGAANDILPKLGFAFEGGKPA